VNEGILLGLIAAISFGTSDTFATLTSRRIGAIRAATGTLVVSLAALVLVAVILQPALPSDPGWIAPVFALGTLVGFAYLCLVNALRLGPISVVSPVFAGTGAATVVFAVLITGDRPAVQEWLGVVAAATGAVLVALSGSGAGGGRARVGAGPAFALAAVLGYSISIILLQGPVRDVGWLPTLVVWRAGNLLVASIVFLLDRSRRPVAAPLEPDVVPRGGHLLDRFGRWGTLVGLLMTGLLETSGQVSRAIGLTVAPAWLIGLVTSLGPVVVITAGVVLLHERLTRAQLAGMACVGVGLVLLTLA
jgi:drug/metabolite transporter (DMT)-like permease